MINKITSRENKLLKTVRSLHNKKGRAQTGLYFAEGVRLVGEALSYITDEVKFILMSDSYAKDNEKVVRDIDKRGIDVYIAPDKLFDYACDTQTPQGIAAVIEMPKINSVDFDKMGYILILDGVSEPGNMGTIIRTAEAAGIELVILMDGCADIYNPKVVRAAMGSLFRMRFLQGDIKTVSELKDKGFSVIATALENSYPIKEIELNGRRAIVIGNEAHGVTPEMLAVADKSVRIDMQGKVESLNAAVAAGIAMYMLKP